MSNKYGGMDAAAVVNSFEAMDPKKRFKLDGAVAEAIICAARHAKESPKEHVKLLFQYVSAKANGTGNGCPITVTEAMYLESMNPG